MDRDVRGPAELALTLRYRANRVHRDDDVRPEAACSLERTARVSLGYAADLDATADRVFGGKMRELAALRVVRTE
jgi:hypothetical protein